MPIDAEQLSTDVDFLTSQPGWQDEPTRRDYIRNVATKSLQDESIDPEYHAAVVGELWNRSKGSRLEQAGDFVANAGEEILKSFPAAGGAAVMAATDAMGVTDSGSGNRLKRGIAGLADGAIQRAKSLHPNDAQEQRDSALDALKTDLDARAYPDGLEAWVAGAPDSELDDETKQWVHGLTWGLGKKAVAADHMGAGGDGSEMLRSWLESDRNPARMKDDTGAHGPRALLGDYLVTRDPSSWEAFKARVQETDTQHKTRLRRYVNEEQLRQVQSVDPKNLSTDLITRSADMQTSPIDLAATVLPFLKGAKAFQAARAGGKAAAAREAVQGIGMEAGSEGLTTALQDPNASTSQILTDAATGGVGAGLVTGTATAAGALANRLASPQIPATAQPPPITPGQEGATDAEFAAQDSASVTGANATDAGSTPAAGTYTPGPLEQIAANSGRVDPLTTASESSTPSDPSHAGHEFVEAVNLGNGTQLHVYRGKSIGGRDVFWVQDQDDRSAGYPGAQMNSRADADSTIKKRAQSRGGIIAAPSPQPTIEPASPEQTSATTQQPATAQAVDDPTLAEPAPEPAPVKFRTFDERGRLKAEKELPHAEAMKELRGRESMLQKLFDCLGRKLA